MNSGKYLCPKSVSFQYQISFRTTRFALQICHFAVLKNVARKTRHGYFSDGDDVIETRSGREVGVVGEGIGEPGAGVDIGIEVLV